jgi:hypothetical protein
MMDHQALLAQAERCRRLARICSTAAIARKFEALAHDYEEHARLARKRGDVYDLRAAAARDEVEIAPDIPLAPKAAKG